jgi:hypothetical protein
MLDALDEALRSGTSPMLRPPVPSAPFALTRVTRPAAVTRPARERPRRWVPISGALAVAAAIAGSLVYAGTPRAEASAAESIPIAVEARAIAAPVAQPVSTMSTPTPESEPVPPAASSAPAVPSSRPLTNNAGAAFDSPFPGKHRRYLGF